MNKISNEYDEYPQKQTNAEPSDKSTEKPENINIFFVETPPENEPKDSDIFDSFKENYERKILRRIWLRKVLSVVSITTILAESTAIFLLITKNKTEKKQ
jgi:hypothetical protein